MIACDRQTGRDLNQARQREWLATNGLGGYSCGTLAMPTRRYHALLVAATAPPAGRSATLVRLEELLAWDSHSIRLDCHEFVSGTVTPSGYQWLERFWLEEGLPVWRYAVGSVVLERRLWMPHGENCTCISYQLIAAQQPITLRLTPLVAWRDHHATQKRRGAAFTCNAVQSGCRVTPAPNQNLDLSLDDGRFEDDPDWHYQFFLSEEAARGYDAVEDLFRPGHLVTTLAPGAMATFTAHFGVEEAPLHRATATREVELLRRQSLLARAGSPDEALTRQLVLAADQFIVRRGTSGASIIAGYPWFSDWGRDTMIALPGLTLGTGRIDEGKQILREWSQWLRDGLLPNTFPEQGAEPEYNSVDASLWFIHAANQLVQATSDHALQHELFGVVKEIVEQYARGTILGIGADPADGLLRAAAPGKQLTWMDAKVGAWVVTPRHGKPVEVNALWFNALRIVDAWSRDLGERGESWYSAAASTCARSFNRRFWYASGKYLFDVVDGEAGDESALRPNQLLAISLPSKILDRERWKPVLEAVTQALLSPMGLRTLAATNTAYHGRYAGRQEDRDAAYHQGTVWPWLLGPYWSAHLAVYGDTSAVRIALASISSHLSEAGMGSLSEIFDGDAPHAPRGCFAQAWSVAECLRIARLV